MNGVTAVTTRSVTNQYQYRQQNYSSEALKYVETHSYPRRQRCQKKHCFRKQERNCVAAVTFSSSTTASTSSSSSSLAYSWRPIPRVHSSWQRKGSKLKMEANAASASSTAATKEEEEAWQKRKEEAASTTDESGEDDNNFGEWTWTLNWNEIVDGIIVGSCPRSASDIDRIADETGATAILCLQCDLCFEALRIPWATELSDRANARGIVMTRVAVRDFDHADQALMLPQAVRQLGVLRKLKKKVYVHCTAGINRATLTVLGFLTFVNKMDLEEAHHLIKSKRSVAHPYIDCWKTTREKILEGRSEEIGAISRSFYESREKSGVGDSGNGDGTGDWYAAERELISRQFQRFIDIDVQFAKSLLSVESMGRSSTQKGSNGADEENASYGGECNIVEEDLDACNIEVHELRSHINRTVAAVESLEMSARESMPWMTEAMNGEDIDIQLESIKPELPVSDSTNKQL